MQPAHHFHFLHPYHPRNPRPLPFPFSAFRVVRGRQFVSFLRLVSIPGDLEFGIWGLPANLKLFALVPPLDAPLDESMPAPRNRLNLILGLYLVIALCVFVPGFLYFTELALRELRFMWWLILLLVGVLWLLTALGRKR
jgi:hypothetical protein